MKLLRLTLDRNLWLAGCSLALGLWTTAAQAGCAFDAGGSYMTYERDMGTFWVPRDAPVGTVIARGAMDTTNNEGAVINCFWNDLDIPTARLPNTAPVFSGSLPPIDGRNVDGYVMQTNVAGVGVYWELFDPFDGSAPNTFRPDHGRPTIPYTGTMASAGPFNLRISRLYGQAWLIKTGPIASGTQRIDGELFHGSIHHLGKVLEYRLRAEVNQAQCSLKADAVSADPVHLGDYKADDFKGVGTTTKPAPFHINLVDCKDASAPLPGTANVYIELDGIDGSKPTVPAQGRFSLTSASDADGVEIQLLRGDTSNPMPLQAEVRMKPVEIGITRLDFYARYYQSSPIVKPGSAEGALSFTVSYK